MLTGSAPDLEYVFVAAVQGEYDPAEQFALSTEIDSLSGAPRAVLSVRDDLTPDEIIIGLQEIEVELRQGSDVLQTHSILIDIAESDFLDEFRQEVIGLASTHVDNAIDNVGSDTGSGGFSLSELLNTGGFVSRRQNRSISDIEATAFYNAFRQSLSDAVVQIENASSIDEYEDGIERRSALSNASVLMNRKLYEDSYSSTPLLAEAARQLRGDLARYGELIHLAFSGYGGNQEVFRETRLAGTQEFAIALVEEPAYTANQALRVELGGHSAMVQSITTNNSGFHFPTFAFATHANTVLSDDVTVVESDSGTVHDHGSLVVVRDGATGEEEHSLLKFDLSNVEETIPDDVRATLQVVSFDSGAQQSISAHWDAWGLTSSGQWSEGTLDWNAYTEPGGIAEGFGPALDTVAITQTGVQQEFDITLATQRALLAGDTNFDGEYDGINRGQRGDIEASYLAVTNWDRYVEVYGGLEVVADGLLYRNDIDQDGDVDANDFTYIQQRIGFQAGDFNADGTVDGADYSVWQKNFGKRVESFADGDGDLDGYVTVNDELLWINTDSLSQAASPLSTNLTLRVTPESDHEVVYDSSEAPAGVDPALIVTGDAQLLLSSFTQSPTFGWQVEYQVLNDSTSGPLEVAIEWVDPVTGVAAVVHTEGSLNSTGGSFAIEPSEITGLPVDGDYVLRATLRLESGVGGSSVREFGGGLFVTTSSGVETWHYYGDERIDDLSLKNSDLNVVLGSGASASYGVQADRVVIQLGDGSDRAYLDGAFLYVDSAHISGGDGDDTFNVPADPYGHNALSVDGGRGFDLLSMEDWLGAIPGTHTLDLNSTAPQFLDGDGPYSITLTLAEPGGIEVVTGEPSNIEVVGRWYADDTIIVDTLVNDFDGDVADGEVSLREAVELSNLMDGLQTIRFDDSLFADGQRTMSLGADLRAHSEALSQMELSSGTVVEGPGSDLLVIDAEGAARLFEIGASLTVTLAGMTLENGFVANTAGGAIYARDHNHLLLNDIVVRDSTAVTGTNPFTAQGGAIYSQGGGLTVVEGYFHGNQGQYGGGIYFGGGTDDELTIRGSTISKNHATFHSGGLSIAGSGSALIENTTISSNNSRKIGGGLYQSGASTLNTTIVNTVVVNNVNDGDTGGGIRRSSGTLTLHNSIVANNQSGHYWARDLSGGVDGFNNLVKDAASSGGLENGVDGNIVGEDPLLLPLGDYGGGIPIHALSPESPAIDRGDDQFAVGLTTDQRGDGYVRNFFGSVDIGSFETKLRQYEHDSKTVLEIHGNVGQDGDDEIFVTPAAVFMSGPDGPAIPIDLSGVDEIHIYARDGDDIVTLTDGLPQTKVYGGAGNDTIFGAESSEEIFGGDGDDTLFGGAGSDTLDGGAGHDIVHGGAGDDQVEGGGGDDTLYGEAGDDHLLGGSGDDFLDGGSGADDLVGGTNNDVLIGGGVVGGVDELRGEEGDDLYRISEAAGLRIVFDTHAAGDSNSLDFSLWSTGLDVDLGASGIQTIDPTQVVHLAMESGAITQVIGSQHADSITGSAYAETLEGRGGDDEVFGGGGDDAIYGGAGADTLFGHSGDVLLDGGYGDDTFLLTNYYTEITSIVVDDPDGFDTIGADSSWNPNAGGMSLDLTVGEAQTVATELSLQINASVEAVVGSGAADDLHGTAQHTIVGAGGFDLVEARSGSDALFFDETGNAVAAPATVNTGFNGQQRELEVGSAEWSFAGLPAGDYRVYATWEGVADAVGSYTVSKSSEPNAEFEAIGVEQSVAPTGKVAWGRTWQDLGGVVRVDGTESINIKLESAGGLALVDGVRLEKIEYALDAAASSSTWSGSGAVTFIALDNGTPVTIQSVDSYGPISDHIAIANGTWAATFTDPGDLASGTYPVTFVVRDGSGGVGVVTVELTHGVANAPPTIGTISSQSATEDGLLSFSFTVTDDDHDETELSFGIGPDAPASLVESFAADPGSVFTYQSTSNSEHTYTFNWTPSEADDGEHTVTIHVTDSGATPVRHARSFTVDVAEDNVQADLRPGSFSFVYGVTNGGTDERTDPTVTGIVENDGTFENVQVAVDWAFDGTFVADQTLALEDDFARPGESTFVITPDSERYFTDILHTGTRVAVQIREFDPATNSLMKTVVPGIGHPDDLSLAYTPVDTGNLSIENFGLLNDTGSAGDLRSADLTLSGGLANPDGPIEGLEVAFYRKETNGDWTWIGSTESDVGGLFEFVPRALSDLTPGGSGVDVKAEVYDPLPTRPPSAPGVTAGLAEEILVSVELLDTVLPEVVNLRLVNDTADTTDSITSDTRIQGSLDDTNSTTSGKASVTIKFDHDPNDSVPFDGIAITDADGDFVYDPAGLADGQQHTIKAWVASWDPFLFREVPAGTEWDDVTFTFDSTANAAPSIEVNSLTLDGSSPVYLPEYTGQITGGLEGVVVEYSLVVNEGAPTQFDEDAISGLVISDDRGEFRVVLDSLDPSLVYDLHVRAVDWDFAQSVGNEKLRGNVESLAGITSSGFVQTVPTISRFELEYDTGIADSDGVTADPTLEIEVVYNGDVNDVEVEIDVDGDQIGDVVLLADADEVFRFTPEGLIDGASPYTFAARARVPDLAYEFDQQTAFDVYDSTIVSVGPNGETATIEWDETDEDANGRPDFVDAWFDELFDVNDQLGGAWYTSDAGLDLGDSLTSDWTSAIQVTLDLDPARREAPAINGMAQRVTGSSPNNNPTLTGTLDADGESGDVLLEFFFVVNGLEVYDGRTRTEADGSFLYTPSTHNTGQNELVVKVHEGIYGSDDLLVRDIVFDPVYTDPIEADVAITETFIGVAVDTNDQVFTGAIEGSNDLAGRLVQFDLDGDGTPDGEAVTDARGRFEFVPSGWPGGAPAVYDGQVLNARVVDESKDEATGETFRTYGVWFGVLNWDAVATDTPAIVRFELKNDTGFADLAGGAGIDSVDYEYRVLDRVTTDSTVTGIVIDAPAGSVVEFSHNGDGMIDGTAVLDAAGRFEYQPEGLSAGYWDLQARVRKADPYTGAMLDSGWQALVAGADPSAFASPPENRGFTLVPTSASTVSAPVLVNPASGSDPQYDPRLRVTVTNADSFENIEVDFFEGSSETGRWIGAAKVDPSGTAEILPIGLTVDGSTLSIVARSRVFDPTRGEEVLGSDSPALVAAFEAASVFTTTPERLYGTSPSDLSSQIDATITGRLSIPNGQVAGVSGTDPTSTPTISTESISPLLVQIRLEHRDSSGLIEEWFDTAAVVAQSRPTGTGTSENFYSFVYRPDMSRFVDGFDSNGGEKLSVYVRPVGVHLDEDFHVGSWLSLTIDAGDYDPWGRTEPAAALSLQEPDDLQSEGVLDANTGAFETTAGILTGSVATSLSDESDEVYVDAQYVEFDYERDGGWDGIADDIVLIEDLGYFEHELPTLGYGELTIRYRLVEEAYVDRQFAPLDQSGSVNNAFAYKDALETFEATRVTGAWKEAKFTLVDAAPRVVTGTLALQTNDAAAGVTPATTDPVVVGSVESSIATDVAGFRVEFDHDGDSLVDGTAITYADGTFEYELLGLSYGEHTVRVRVVDDYSDRQSLVGQWNDFTFVYNELAPATLQSFGLEVEVEASGHGGPGTETVIVSLAGQQSLNPVLAGALGGYEKYRDVLVEFDYDGDGVPDAAVTAAEDGAFRFEPRDLPFGEVTVGARVVGFQGAGAVEGQWSTEFSFFHASLDAPAIGSVTYIDEESATLTGRVTVGGFGATALVEIRLIDAGQETLDGYARADGNGVFTYTPTRPSSSVTALKLTPINDSSSAAPIVGEAITEAIPVGFSPTLGAVTLGAIELPFPHPSVAVTDASSVVADPTIRGVVTGDVTGAIVEFDYDQSNSADAEAEVRADGTFEHTPVGLAVGQQLIRVRTKIWDPTAVDYAYGSWNEQPDIEFTLDPSQATAPEVISLALQAAPSSTLAGSAALFAGTVASDGRKAGLTVYFDHNHDGVPEGETITRADGSFHYLANGIAPLSVSQKIRAWVSPPEYLQVETQDPFTLLFTIDDVFQFSAIGYEPIAQKLSGVVDLKDSSATTLQVEYMIVGDEASTLPTGPFSSPADPTVSTIALAADGSFTIDAATFDAGPAVLFARVLDNSGVEAVAGHWTRLAFTVPGSTAEGTALAVTDVRLANDTGSMAGHTNDPTILGQVGADGEGAFAVVEVNYSGDTGAGYSSDARVTADRDGRFRYTAPVAAGQSHTVRFRSVLWNATLGEEEYSDWTVAGAENEVTFTLTSDTNPAVINNFGWATPPVAGEVSNPTVTGSVTGLGRQAGIRVEFDHTGDEEADGFTYTDANGEFTYTALGLTPTTGGADLEIRARVVAWNEQSQEYERANFGDHATENSVESVSAELTADSPVEPTLDGATLRDLTSEQLAFAGLRDAVLAALSHSSVGLAGSGAGTIDVGVGELLLLHRGGGEGDLAEDFFTVNNTMPTAGQQSASSPVQITNHTTPDGGLLTGEVTFDRNIAVAGDKVLVEVSFSLANFSYTIDAVGLDDELSVGGRQTVTQLEISGSEYSVSFDTVDNAAAGFSAALYTPSHDQLLDLWHSSVETVEYDYWVYETVTVGDEDASAGEPTTTAIVDTGENAYAFNLGGDGVGASLDPARYDHDNTASPYSAVFSHTQEDTFNVWASGHALAGLTVAGDATSDNPAEAHLRTTYVQSVTKTGAVGGVTQQAIGQIHRSISETTEQTTSETVIIENGSEQSSETTTQTERLSRHYSLSGSYIAGVSASGTATLSESRDSIVTIAGTGVVDTDSINETWSYEVTSTLSSNLQASGQFFESLDSSAPLVTSTVSGTYGASIDYSGVGRGAAAFADGGVSGSSKSSFTMTLSRALDESFQAERIDASRRSSGIYTIDHRGLSKEVVEGHTEEGVGDGLLGHEIVTYRQVVTGQATSSRSTDYVSVSGPNETGSQRRTDVTADAVGHSRMVVHVRGSESFDADGDGSNEGFAAYQAISATSAKITTHDDGTRTAGAGQIDGAPADSSRKGASRTTTDINARTASYVSSYTPDDGPIKSLDQASTDEAIAQLYSYDDDDRRGSTRTTSTDKASRMVFRGGHVRFDDQGPDVAYVRNVLDASSVERTQKSHGVLGFSTSGVTANTSYEAEEKGKSLKRSKEKRAAEDGSSGSSFNSWSDFSFSESGSGTVSDSGAYQSSGQRSENASEKNEGSSWSIDSGPGFFQSEFSKGSDRYTRLADGSDAKSGDDASSSVESNALYNFGANERGMGRITRYDFADGVTTRTHSEGHNTAEARGDGSADRTSRSNAAGQSHNKRTNDGSAEDSSENDITTKIFFRGDGFGGARSFTTNDSDESDSSGTVSRTSDGDHSRDLTASGKSTAANGVSWSDYSNLANGYEKASGVSSGDSTSEWKGDHENSGLEATLELIRKSSNEASGEIHTTFDDDPSTVNEEYGGRTVTWTSSGNLELDGSAKLEDGEQENTGSDESGGGELTIESHTWQYVFGDSFWQDSFRDDTHVITSKDTDDGETVTNTHTWDGKTETDSENFEGKFHSVDKSYGENTATTTTGGERESATADLESYREGNSKRRYKTESEDPVTGEVDHASEDIETSEWYESTISHYTSSHDVGEDGQAIGGTFHADQTIDSYRKTRTEQNSERLYQGAVDFWSTSAHEIIVDRSIKQNEDGTYHDARDTGGGYQREQSGKHKTNNHNETVKKTLGGEWKEDQYFSGSQFITTDNRTSETTGSYSPAESKSESVSWSTIVAETDSFVEVLNDPPGEDYNGGIDYTTTIKRSKDGSGTWSQRGREWQHGPDPFYNFDEPINDSGEFSASQPSATEGGGHQAETTDLGVEKADNTPRARKPKLRAGLSERTGSSQKIRDNVLGFANYLGSLIPGVGTAKDAAEAISGERIITDKPDDKLTASERVEAGGSAALGLLGGGSVNGAGDIRRAARGLDEAADAGKVTNRLDDASRVKRADDARGFAKAETVAPGGVCFVAGTPVVQHVEERRPTDIQIVQAEVEPSDDSSSLLRAASASLIAIAGLSLPERRSRKQRTGDVLRNNSIDRSSEGDRMTGRESSPKAEGASPTTVPPAAPPASNPACRRSSLLRTAWLACCLSVAGFLAFSGLGGSQPSPPVTKAVQVASVAADPTIAIERIRVGDRVAGSYSAGELAGETHVDPTTWRKLSLRSEHRWEDGTLDVMNVSTLQPPEWIAEHRPEVGATVPLPLDLLEMGLQDGLEATVVANEPCPAIQDGPGRVVLTTVDHLNDNVYELAFATPAGESESVRTTGLHKFYRPAGDAWVSAHDLREGDRLEGPDGPLVVQSLAKVPGVHRVYNITVETEHVYRVSKLGALVHNNGCAQQRPIPDPRRRPGYDPGDIHDDHPIARSLGGDPDVTRPFPGGANLRKGGLEGELRRYEKYLKENTDLTDEQIRSVIQSEIDGLARDVIASPYSKVFPGGTPPSAQ